MLIKRVNYADPNLINKQLIAMMMIESTDARLCFFYVMTSLRFKLGNQPPPQFLIGPTNDRASLTRPVFVFTSSLRFGASE